MNIDNIKIDKLTIKDYKELYDLLCYLDNDFTMLPEDDQEKLSHLKSKIFFIIQDIK